MYINPVTIGKVKWEQYRLLTESKLRAAQPVTVLVRPLSFRYTLFLFLTHQFLPPSWCHYHDTRPLTNSVHSFLYSALPASCPIR